MNDILHKNIIEKIKIISLNHCENNDRFYFHIELVVKNIIKLHKYYPKADLEALIIGAYLHDITKPIDKDNHHISWAIKAKKILKKLDFSNDKIKKIYQMIYCHRWSKDIEQKSIEDKLLASADALSHFQNVVPIFYSAFKVYQLDIWQWIEKVKNKLERSFKKISIKEAKKEAEKNYKLFYKLIF